MCKKEIETILKLEGVNAQGYGIISQAIMFDKDISITAKGIYAYFASHLGSGRTIFPKRETILTDLKISKNAYYKHFNQLKEHGYVKVSKMKGYINRNIYTLCNNPKKVITKAATKSNDKHSMLSIDGINATGYGFIPKLIMKDGRLSIKAKSLIAFFYSLVQSGNTAFPHRDTICVFLNISKDIYYNALNQLIDLNYVTVKQRHNKLGKFSVNDYILNSNPKATPCLENCDNIENPLNTENTPCPEKRDNEENGINSKVLPCQENEDNEQNNCVGKNETLPCQENCDNNNITSVNSYIYNISSSNLNLTYIPYSTDKDEIRKIIYDLTYYDKLIELGIYDNDMEARTYKKVVNAIIDMLCVKEHTRYNNQYVRTKDLFNYLSDCIDEDLFGYSLRDLIFHIIINFDIVRQKYVIKRPYEYLKAYIWHTIKNYGI